MKQPFRFARRWGEKRMKRTKRESVVLVIQKLKILEKNSLFGKVKISPSYGGWKTAQSIWHCFFFFFWGMWGGVGVVFIFNLLSLCCITLLCSGQPISWYMLPTFPTFWAEHVHGRASILDSPSNSLTKPQKLTTQVNFKSFSAPNVLPHSVISQSTVWSCNCRSSWESRFPLLKQKARVSHGIKPELHLWHLEEFSSRYVMRPAPTPTEREHFPCGPGPS